MACLPLRGAAVAGDCADGASPGAARPGRYRRLVRMAATATAAQMSMTLLMPVAGTPLPQRPAAAGPP